MLYLRICFDSPGMDALRSNIRAEHRAYLVPFLEPGKDVQIIQAGPMCVNDTDDTNAGSFFILEAPSIIAVESFHAGDPFTKSGVFGDTKLIRWDRHIGNPGEPVAVYAAQNAGPGK